MQKTTSKTIGAIIIALFAISIVSPLMMVRASVGAPELAYVDTRGGTPTVVVEAEFNISITAGSPDVKAIDGTAVTPPAYFAILTKDDDGQLVTFSGAQFDLYISKDGYSQLSPDDKRYTQGMLVSDLEAEYPKNVSVSNPILRGGSAVFTLGAFDFGGFEYNAIVGPIPYNITADYKFIKIWDGQVAVAVSAETVNVLPSLNFSPTSGTSGRQVTLSGVALEANRVLNLTYSYEGGPSPSPAPSFAANLTTDAIGQFSYTWNILDLKREFTGVDEPIPYDPIYIYVYYNRTSNNFVGNVTYNEYRRAFWQVRSYYPNSNTIEDYVQASSAANGYGNNTFYVDVYIGSRVTVAGLYFNPTGNATFNIDGTISLGSAVVNSTGGFNFTFYVPSTLSMGIHQVRVTNNGVLYIFEIEVEPTLILTPATGPVATTVNATAFGFPANTKVYLYWNELQVNDGLWYWIANATTGSNGQFNVTVSFSVPHAYGGDHTIAVTTTYYGNTTDVMLFAEEEEDLAIAAAVFTITPRFRTQPSTVSNDGSMFTAIGDGFNPDISYGVNVDNQFMQPSTVWYVTPNAVGDINITLIAAGFYPGKHVIALYPPPTVPGFYTTNATAIFTVSTTGDALGGLIGSMNNNLTSSLAAISSSLSGITGTISSISGNIAAIQANTGSISGSIGTLSGQVSTMSGQVATVLTSVSSLSSSITSIDGEVATLSTSIGTLTTNVNNLEATITSIEGDIATVQTTLGTLEGKITAIDGKIATVQTDVGTVKANVGSIQSDVQAIPTEPTVDLSQLSTPVWIAVIFAIIAAIAAIASIVLVRRKIAG